MKLTAIKLSGSNKALGDYREINSPLFKHKLKYYSKTKFERIHLIIRDASRYSISLVRAWSLAAAGL